MAQKDYISEERMSEYDVLIKQYIEERRGGDIAIEDKPALGKLLVTLNPDKPNQEQYLVSRDEYTAPAKPTFSPATGGSGNGSLTVTISTNTSGATVKYKIGSGSWQTGTSVTLSQDTAQQSKSYTLTAKAVKDDLESDEVTASYTVYRQVAQPTYASASGNKYSSSRTITFACDTAGATIQYKIGNGSWTDGSSVTINATSKITIRAIKDGWVNSSSPTAVTYTIGANRSYIGQAASVTTEADVKNLSNAYDLDTLVGTTQYVDVSSTSATSEYVWFAIPNTAAKTLVVTVNNASLPTPVPLQDAAGSTMGAYRVWRTESKLFNLTGQYDFKFA